MVNSPMSSRTRSQVKKSGSGAYKSPPLFHRSVQSQAPILQQYKIHPQLFIERKVTEQTMEKIYFIVRYWILSEDCSPNELMNMLLSIHKSLTFVAFEDGAWWRLARKPAGKIYKWWKQTIVFASNCQHLVNDVSETTKGDRFRPNIISCAVYNKGLQVGFRVLKWPHFGTQNSLKFNFDGSERHSPLCQEDLRGLVEDLKAVEVATPLSLTTSEERAQQVSLIRNSDLNDMHKSQQNSDTQTTILDFISQQPQATQSTSQNTESIPEPPDEIDTSDRENQEAYEIQDNMGTQRIRETQQIGEEAIQDQIKDTNSTNNNNNVEVLRKGPSENNSDKDNTNIQQPTEATNTMTDPNTENESNDDNTNNNINEDTRRPKNL